MCVTPIRIGQGSDAMVVGCGKCMPCHIKYCNQWRFRMLIHANNNPVFHCVTLTYTNDHLPIVKSEYNGKNYMTLVKADTQNFFKLLRYYTNERYKQYAPKVSYLISGEYGDKLKRPHYHAIIFNAHPDDILKSWTKGAIHFGDSDLEATVNYALKYTLKSRIHTYYHKGSPYIRPFMTCSKGIGIQLVSTEQRRYGRHVIKCIHNVDLPDNVHIGNNKTSLPRYYQNIINKKIDTEEHKIKAIKKEMELNSKVAKSGKTRIEYNKMYHKYLWQISKEQMYDNEITMDIPPELQEYLNNKTITNH